MINMVIYARMMSGKIFIFELDVSCFIYKVKKLRYMISREIRELPQNIKIFKEEELIDDSELLTEEEYNVFVDV
jgi:hypothetical protein